MVYNGGVYNNTDPRRGEALADSIHVWYNWMTKRDWYFFNNFYDCLKLTTPLISRKSISLAISLASSVSKSWFMHLS